jgi:hypothetical protein
MAKCHHLNTRGINSFATCLGSLGNTTSNSIDRVCYHTDQGAKVSKSLLLEHYRWQIINVGTDLHERSKSLGDTT